MLYQSQHEGEALGGNLKVASFSPTSLPRIKNNLIGVTNIGRGRQKNQDAVSAYFISSMDQPSLILSVADGLGCFEYSEKASLKAVSEIPLSIKNGLSIEESCLKVHQDLLKGQPCLIKRKLAFQTKIPKASPDDYGATTLVSVKIEAGSVSVSNIGDSRAYLIRDHQIIFKTRDQSIIELMKAENQLDEVIPDNKKHPLGHVILNALGGTQDSFRFIENGKIVTKKTGLPLLEEYDLCEGDILLLASDGFFGNLNEDEFLKFLKEEEWGNLSLKISSHIDSILEQTHPARLKPNFDNYSFVIYRHSKEIFET